jgi:hypothetical protein
VHVLYCFVPCVIQAVQVVEPGSVAPRTLYGVCCYVRELVHRPPSMAKEVGCGLGMAVLDSMVLFEHQSAVQCRAAQQAGKRPGRLQL